jgi:hypothetical protein
MKSPHARTFHNFFNFVIVARCPVECLHSFCFGKIVCCANCFTFRASRSLQQHFVVWGTMASQQPKSANLLFVERALPKANVIVGHEGPICLGPHDCGRLPATLMTDRTVLLPSHELESSLSGVGEHAPFERVNANVIDQAAGSNDCAFFKNFLWCVFLLCETPQAAMSNSRNPFLGFRSLTVVCLQVSLEEQGDATFAILFAQERQIWMPRQSRI